MSDLNKENYIYKFNNDIIDTSCLDSLPYFLYKAALLVILRRVFLISFKLCMVAKIAEHVIVQVQESVV